MCMLHGLNKTLFCMTRQTKKDLYAYVCYDEVMPSCIFVNFFLSFFFHYCCRL